MGIKKIIPSWLFFVASRFSYVDRNGRSALTGLLATLGITFGVMTLIVVLAVMNGFQAGSIQSILEISSYHVRATVNDSFVSNSNSTEIANTLKNNELVESVTPFIDAQSLIVGSQGRQGVALLRFVPHNILQIDTSLSNQLHLVSGNFLEQKESVVLGYALARTLGVEVGDTINLLAMSGGSDVDLFAQNRTLMVSGIFECSFSEINNSFAFIRLDDSSKLLGNTITPMYGIKLHNSENASRYISVMKNKLSSVMTFESWQYYNRSFFGALRVEKNILMMLVFLIFIVVGINIFNSMRRMIYERSEEISILSALGASKKKVQAIFLVQGVRIGLTGSLSGLLLGLLLSVRMDLVFKLVANITYYVQYFFIMLIQPSKSAWITENVMFQYYAQVPAQPRFAETALITLFGVFSAVAAAWFASRHILKLSVAEVLRNE